MKILYGYPYYDSKTYGDVEKLTLNYLNRLKLPGVNIEGICLTLSPPNSCLSFHELERMWKRGDRLLLRKYDEILRRLEGYDVFINAAGINLHPRFVESLNVFTVFGCNDDPESSEFLSKPVASSYDLCLVGNIAELDNYKKWGAKHVAWRPLGLSPEIYSEALTYDQVLNSERDIGLFMMIDRNFPVRKSRLDRMNNAFPEAHFYGHGWPRGILPASDQLSLLQRSKIGPNFHNSTGPINYRTFYLPANGVLQICDNKSHLAKIYKMGEEVIGFDTVDECIDLCRYYLDHDEERRKIAANGWKRAVEDYNEVSIFTRDVELIKSLMKKKEEQKQNVLSLQYKNTKHFRAIDFFSIKLKHGRKKIKKLIKSALLFCRKKNES